MARDSYEKCSESVQSFSSGSRSSEGKEYVRLPRYCPNMFVEDTFVHSQIGTETHSALDMCMVQCTQMATSRSHRISTTNLLHLELTFIMPRTPFLFLTKAPHGPGVSLQMTIPRGPAWHADVSLPWVAGSLVKEAARSCWK